MSYVKTDSNNNILMYPYTFDDLKNENPNTKYNMKKSLVDYYNSTEEAIDNQYNLYEVILDNSIPEEYDHAVHSLIFMEEPEFDGENWRLAYVMREASIEELEERKKVTGPYMHD